MDFGIFMEFEIRAANQAGAFEEGFHFVDVAEAWGLDIAWLGEMHFSPSRSVLSAPIAVASAIASEETFPRVGQMGLPIFVGLRGMDISGLSRHLKAYREAWQAAGHPGEGDVCLRIPVYAAPTEKAAREEPHDSITYYFARQAELTKGAVGREGAGPADRQQARVDRLATLSYDQLLNERVVFGSPAGLIDRLTRLRDELYLGSIAAELNSGGMLSRAQSERTLQIMTQEVMPAFK